MKFTAEQIEKLAAKLDYGAVKERKQGGRQVSYIEGWHAIAEANRIFGFDGWGRETIEMRMVSEAETIIAKDTRYEKDGWRIGYVAKVRIGVLMGDGEMIVREGTGFGSGIDADRGQAHESAVKEAETDAMKRALMTFGNPFGLALYDKTQAEVDHGEPEETHFPHAEILHEQGGSPERGPKPNGKLNGKVAAPKPEPKPPEPDSRVQVWANKVIAALANARSPADVEDLLERCQSGLAQADADDKLVAMDVRARFAARKLVLQRTGGELNA